MPLVSRNCLLAAYTHLDFLAIHGCRDVRVEIAEAVQTCSMMSDFSSLMLFRCAGYAALNSSVKNACQHNIL